MFWTKVLILCPVATPRHATPRQFCIVASVFSAKSVVRISTERLLPLLIIIIMADNNWHSAGLTSNGHKRVQILLNIYVNTHFDHKHSNAQTHACTHPPTHRTTHTHTHIPHHSLSLSLSAYKTVSMQWECRKCLQRGQF